MMRLIFHRYPSIISSIYMGDVPFPVLVTWAFSYRSSLVLFSHMMHVWCVTRISSGFLGFEFLWFSMVKSPHDLMVHHLPHFIFCWAGLLRLVYLILRHGQMMMIVDPIIIHYPIISYYIIKSHPKILSCSTFPSQVSYPIFIHFQCHTYHTWYRYYILIKSSYMKSLLSGQDYFKQSNTRLHFIADRATVMSLELLGEPWHMVDEISALGLRHVGYGIPTETWRRTWRSGTLPPCPWCSHQQSSNNREFSGIFW